MTKKQLRQHRLKKQTEQNLSRGVKTPDQLRDEAFRQLYDEPLDRYANQDNENHNDV